MKYLLWTALGGVCLDSLWLVLMCLFSIIKLKKTMETCLFTSIINVCTVITFRLKFSFQIYIQQ